MKRILLLSLFIFSLQSIAYSQWSAGIDFGTNLKYPQYDDARNQIKIRGLQPSLRVASNVTYSFLRLEIGATRSHYEAKDLYRKSYNGKSIESIKGQVNVMQYEGFLLFVKNVENRVSFIGFGSIELHGAEKLKLTYTDNSEQEFNEKPIGKGYQFMVGGRDKDSNLKVSFSYSSVRLRTALGDSFDAGGYALTFSFALSSIL